MEGLKREFETLQRARESCRAYSPRPVEREKLQKLEEIAALSPSGCNGQPWRFIIVDEDGPKAGLVEALDDDGLTGCPWGGQVPAFIVIYEAVSQVMPKVKERYGTQRFAQLDIGMAAMSLCLAATDMGLGTCMIGTMSQNGMQRALGIPEGRPVRLLIAVGYPAVQSAPRPKARMPLDQILTWNHG